MSTLATFRRNVQNRLGLDTTASSTEETLVDEWLNRGVVDVLLRTRCNVNPATITLTANVADYTMGTTILSILDLTYTSSGSNVTTPLERTTPAEILRLRQASTTTGSVLLYALNGSDLIMLYPTPSAADTITFYYVPRPTAMSVTSHDPSVEAYGGIPTEYHEAIEKYALWQGGDYLDDVSSSFGMQYQQQYMMLVKDFKKAMWKKGGRNLGPAVVGKRRGLVASDPSQDFGGYY